MSRAHAGLWTAAAILLTALALSPATQAQFTYPGQCREISVDDAMARGSALALRVQVGNTVIQPVAPASTQLDGAGRGNASAQTQLLSVSLPGSSNPIVTAELLKSRVDLDVDNESLMESEAWAQSTLLHLDILNGTVTADTVKAWAYAISTIQSARTYNHQSEIEGLRVAGVSITKVSPNMEIPLTSLLPGSYVSVHHREDNSRFPGDGRIFYEANVTVTMIHVHIERLALDPIDIMVSQAHAYAQSPTPWCGLRQSVEAGGYNLRARAWQQPSILLGENHIGVTGGNAYQVYAYQNVTLGGFRVETAWAEVNATGEVIANVVSKARAVEKIGGLCVQVGDDECFIEAEFIRAESNSRADENGAISWGSVTIIGLKVGGIDVCEALNMPDDDNQTFPDGQHPNVCKPARNTFIDLGIAKVTLNQRERHSSDGHTAYYVRAVRIDIPGGMNPPEGNAGTTGTVIIGRAYTAADYQVIG